MMGVIERRLNGREIRSGAVVGWGERHEGFEVDSLAIPLSTNCFFENLRTLIVVLVSNSERSSRISLRRLRESMVLWGIRPPDPPDPAEMLKLRHFKA